MKLIDCIGITKDYGGEPVLSGVSFSVGEGERMALVGANGAGKSTLLGIVMGRDEDYKGKVERARGLRLGYLEQNPSWAPGLSALEILLLPARKAEAALRASEEALGADSSAAALDRYSRAREAYEALGAEGAEEAALRLLDGAGLGKCARTAAASLSGGERGMLALAAALSARPALLVLDEPGNHFDFAALAWLEERMAGFKGGILFASHDRRLIDQAATAVLELAGGAGAVYSGGYSAYRVEKLKRLSSQGQAWQADRKKLERLEALVARFEQIARSRPDPAWGKRLRARRSQLARERESAAERPEAEEGAKGFRFRCGDSRSEIALEVRGYSLERGGRGLLDKAGFLLQDGERAAIVGPNGSGKTSLLSDIVAFADWERADLRMPPSRTLGYCAQDPGDAFRGKTVLELALALDAAGTGIAPNESAVAKFLRPWGFSREDLGRGAGSLSGGEANRLQLALASMRKADLLVLDEPTNHLDIPSREALEEALDEYPGTVLVVSHDRWFLERVAGRIVFFEERSLREYEGSFAEWWRDCGPRATVPAVKGSPAADEAEAARNLEARIEEMEREKGKLEKEAAGRIEARRFAEGRALAEKARKLSDRIEELYRKWAG